MSTAPVFAATIPLGSFSDDDTRNFDAGTYTGGASINQSYQFTLTETADLSLSLTNSFAKLSQEVSGLTLNFDGANGTTQTIFTNSPSNTMGFELAYYSTSGLGPGTYTFTVTGTAGSAGSSVDGNIAVSAVPLPATAPMFGAALLALGAAGYAAKRKKAAAV